MTAPHPPGRRGRPSRRAEIFASALRLFRARGFHATSINDIGADAGVAGTAIYSHFATKQEVLAEAIAAGGSTLRDHVAPSGEIGYFQHSFRVYGREGEPCLHGGCDARIRRIVQSGRSTFFCPRCQHY